LLKYKLLRCSADCIYSVSIIVVLMAMLSLIAIGIVGVEMVLYFRELRGE